MSAGMFCLFLQGIECANCTDASWHYRGEQPIYNDRGVLFCDVECADEWDERVEREEALRASNWCPACGYDNWEHADDCNPGAVEGSVPEADQ